MTEDPWSLLGIAPTAETDVIRQAFSARLKAISNTSGPEAIEQLVEARDRVLSLAQTQVSDSQSPPTSQSNWSRAHLIALGAFIATIVALLIVTKLNGTLRPVKVDDQLKFPAPEELKQGD